MTQEACSEKSPNRTILSAPLPLPSRDLAPRDISGTSDPFARVLFNNHSAETSVSMGNIHTPGGVS